MRRSKEQGKVYAFRLDSYLEVDSKSEAEDSGSDTGLGRGPGRDAEKIREWIDENTRAIVDWKVEDDVREGLEWIEEQCQRQRRDGK